MWNDRIAVASCGKKSCGLFTWQTVTSVVPNAEIHR